MFVREESIKKMSFGEESPDLDGDDAFNEDEGLIIFWGSQCFGNRKGCSRGQMDAQ